MVRDGIALPNTHDSFYFGSILQKALYEKHQKNHLIPSVYTNGMITYLPYLLLKAFPDQWTIEELLLKIPVWVAGLVCIPIVLIGRLYGSSLWGFFAACLAGVAHSYYNRTLAGLLRHGHVFDYRPRFRFLFLVGRIKERIGRLSRCGRSDPLFEQVFLRFDPSHYLRHVLGLHVLSPWNFPSGHWFFLSLKHSSSSTDGWPSQTKVLHRLRHCAFFDSLLSFYLP